MLGVVAVVPTTIFGLEDMLWSVPSDEAYTKLLLGGAEVALPELIAGADRLRTD